MPGYKATSWAAGYGDYVMKPDLATLRVVPWLPGTALVLADVLDHHTHADVPHSPRAMLKRQIARLHALGYQAMMASELEFFLFRQSFDEAHAAGYRGLAAIGLYNQDYHIFQTTKDEEVMRAIRTGLTAAGIPVENSKGEASAGQEEINVVYADALAAADGHAVVKNAVKEIAWSKGRAVTFMAKYDTRQAGSSCHVHLSLRALDGQPAFHDAGEPLAMSKTMRHWVAGLLAHASEITYFLAPYVNSYKRFVAGTFAPTKAIWSTDNRTAGYRLVGEGTKSVRIECRIGGADLTPHLAYAALDRRRMRRRRGRARARARVPRRRLSRRGARDPEDAARRHRGPARVGHAAGGLRRRGDRPLRPRRPLGAVRMRPQRHRLGGSARLRAGVTARN